MKIARNALIDRYRTSIARLEYRNDKASDKELLLWQDQSLDCFYAPFDHVNTNAKIIVVGITPGRSQMNRALTIFKQYARTNDELTALLAVKQQASLSGSMRAKIIQILNKLGYPQQLGIHCSSSLWGQHSHLVHFCSLLKYPVFINAKDYCGQVQLFKNPKLVDLLMTQFVNDLADINPSARIVPLGAMVASFLDKLEQQGRLSQTLSRYRTKVIAPPHPSGANAESISLLLSEPFPTLEHYQQRMYDSYLRKSNWLNGQTTARQTEHRYKKAREARWQAVNTIRKAYRL